MSSTIGAIFCHVNKIKQFIHLNPSITSGNQKWNGAAPIFVSNAELRIIIENCENSRLLIEFDLVIIIMIENRRIVDAIACVMKYFNDDSVDKIFFCLENRGMIDNKLISRPNHIPIHEYDEMAVKVPITIEDENMILYIFVIKKKRGITFINGV